MDPNDMPSALTWADHVRAGLGDDQPYDSDLADLLADDDRWSADHETETGYLGRL